MKQDMKKQVFEQHKKEMESLKTNQENKLKEIEEKHQTKIKEMLEDLEGEKADLKKEYEDKIIKMEEKHSSIIRAKDREIARLEDIIQRECTRFEASS